MNPGGQEREEEYHKYLRADTALDFILAHTDLLHDREALSVLETFGNLLVVDDQDCCHQEECAEESAEEEHAAVKRIGAALTIGSGFHCAGAFKIGAELFQYGIKSILCLFISSRIKAIVEGNPASPVSVDSPLLFGTDG